MYLAVVRKKHCIAVVLCIMAIFTFSFVNDILMDSRQTFFPVTNKVVFIDAGHGGRDPGAVGGSGKLEKDINLAIAMRLKRLVEGGGGIAILTRDDDYGLYSPDAPNKKREDLQARKRMADESQSSINIIIHLNSFPQSKYYGAQTFYYSQSEDSKRLATIMQQELRRVLNEGNNRQPKPDSEIYLLKNTQSPTVLIECGFLSNPTEEQLLDTEIYQEKVAWAIYLGILRYLSEG